VWHNISYSCLIEYVIFSFHSLLYETKFTGICSEGKSRTLDWQEDSPRWQCHLHVIHRVFISSRLRNPLQIGWSTLFTWLLALSKIKKKISSREKIWWHSWHPAQDTVAVRYSKKKKYFQDPFHKGRHCLTKWVASQVEYFKGNGSQFCSRRAFWELNSRTSYVCYAVKLRRRWM
jgi:hypothetical protein